MDSRFNELLRVAKSSVFFALLTFTTPAAQNATAQTTDDGGGTTWQELWQELTISDDETADDPDAAADDAYSLLEQLAANPIDINSATTADLEQLPFLSAQQVADLLHYRDRYGALRSAGELRMLPSLGHEQLQLLPFFIVFGPEKPYEPAQQAWADTLPRQWQRGLPPHRYQRQRHELAASLRVPFYRRKGDRDGYMGYPYRHELRYELTAGRHLRAGLLGAQDAGEPFFSSHNRWGYDYYTFFVQLRKQRAIDNLVVGRYKLTAAKGLVMGGSTITGKMALLQSLGRTATTLRPHMSRSEDAYLQGAAAMLRLMPGLTLTPFVSMRQHDATLTTDGAVQTIVGSGYHRTQAEMDKKHNTRATDVGARAELRRGPVQAGLTAVYSHLDRPLDPGTGTLYRRYWPSGRHFANVSADYAWHLQRLRIEGETAIDRHGHVATLNTLSLQPSASWSVMALQRFYSYRYESLHARSLSEGGRVQNESALLLGATWRPARQWQLQAYADYAYFPWARYLVSQSSSATDVLLSASWQQRTVTLTARYRLHSRQRDNEDKTALYTQTDHRLRLALQWHPQQSPWRLVSGADLGHTRHQDASTGLMLSQTVTWQQRQLLVSALAAWFHTDDYASRLYLNERRMPHEYGFAQCFGHGLRLSALARATMGRWQLHARLGLTRYLDRTTIGSGLQQTSHRGLTDLDFQLHYRLFQ